MPDNFNDVKQNKYDSYNALRPEFIPVRLKTNSSKNIKLIVNTKNLINGNDWYGLFTIANCVAIDSINADKYIIITFSSEPDVKLRSVFDNQYYADKFIQIILDTTLNVLGHIKSEIVYRGKPLYDKTY